MVVLKMDNDADGDDSNDGFGRSDDNNCDDSSGRSIVNCLCSDIKLFSLT